MNSPTIGQKSCEPWVKQRKAQTEKVFFYFNPFFSGKDSETYQQLILFLKMPSAEDIKVSVCQAPLYLVRRTSALISLSFTFVMLSSTSISFSCTLSASAILFHSQLSFTIFKCGSLNTAVICQLGTLTVVDFCITKMQTISTWFK